MACPKQQAANPRAGRAQQKAVDQSLGREPTGIYCVVFPQAIQHIEGTQEKQLLEEEEQRRGAVIVTPARASLDPSNSDTASDLETEDNDSMEHSKAGMP